MPYITEDDRNNIDLSLVDWAANTVNRSVTLKDLFDDLLACDESPTPGELNYIITTLVHCYVRRKGLRYTTLNDVVGVLNCANSEFYRRVIAPYEDKKIKENGCISELDDDSCEKIR